MLPDPLPVPDDLSVYVPDQHPEAEFASARVALMLAELSPDDLDALAFIARTYRSETGDIESDIARLAVELASLAPLTRWAARTIDQYWTQRDEHRLPFVVAFSWARFPAQAMTEVSRLAAAFDWRRPPGPLDHSPRGANRALSDIMNLTTIGRARAHQFNEIMAAAAPPAPAADLAVGAAADGPKLLAAADTGTEAAAAFFTHDVPGDAGPGPDPIAGEQRGAPRRRQAAVAASVAAATVAATVAAGAGGAAAVAAGTAVVGGAVGLISMRRRRFDGTFGDEEAPVGLDAGDHADDHTDDHTDDQDGLPEPVAVGPLAPFGELSAASGDTEEPEGGVDTDDQVGAIGADAATADVEVPLFEEVDADAAAMKHSVQCGQWDFDGGQCSQRTAHPSGRCDRHRQNTLTAH